MYNKLRNLELKKKKDTPVGLIILVSSLIIMILNIFSIMKDSVGLFSTDAAYKTYFENNSYLIFVELSLILFYIANSFFWNYVSNRKREIKLKKTIDKLDKTENKDYKLLVDLIFILNENLSNKYNIKTYNNKHNCKVIIAEKSKAVFISDNFELSPMLFDGKHLKNNTELAKISFLKSSDTFDKFMFTNIIVTAIILFSKTYLSF